MHIILINFFIIYFLSTYSLKSVNLYEILFVLNIYFLTESLIALIIKLKKREWKSILYYIVILIEVEIIFLLLISHLFQW